ncbi:MAG TPA: RIP metalloprotease RseP [Steroidobacteraceae bacterium]|nr:RIP metalloprotease RseP [Steroidobacteraceae bacterium]
MSFSWHTLWAFLAAICLLVAVHEYGHFWVARRLGFRVLRFSIGFGKAIWKRTGRDGTEYMLAMIPLGGYVKLLDEREGPVPTDQLHEAFTRRPHWQRIAVLLAGPAFNILFAILVLSGMYWANGVNEPLPNLGPVPAHSAIAGAGAHEGDEIVSVNGAAVHSRNDVWLALLDAISQSGSIRIGFKSPDGTLHSGPLDVGDADARRQLTEPAALMAGLGLEFYSPPLPAVLGNVAPEGPAGRAGLRSGDEILSINGEAVHSFDDMVKQIQPHPGENLTLRYRRQGREDSVHLTTLSSTDKGRTIGRILVTQPLDVPEPASILRHRDLAPGSAFVLASAECWHMTTLQARLMWRMLTGHVSVKNLSGPISIAEYAGDTAAAGPAAFTGFLVMISLALGFMNLLPIPILDGGQVVMQAIEWFKGSPLSERTQLLGQQFGILLLVALMGVALFNDIVRQFG